MPLKFKVGKRRGSYELSKDLYVISVQLMDDAHPPLQCTMSAESTGKDCLDYTCQRLEIKQGFYFGLRYKAKEMYRWVELDKPLRKQLERHGAKPHEQQRLQFAVMFHAPTAPMLTDEATRYYYFVQMKTDIIEGRLLVTPAKAILLASYVLQVELGDHDENIHTATSLQRFALLPKHMAPNPGILEEFFREMVLGHKSLRGLPPSQAELLYIAEAQQCEGYGEDYFQARDEDGNDAFVGYCLEGIIVKRLHGVPIKYRWDEVSRITCHKRTFSINFREVSSIPFTMEDCETCKYAALICNLQLAFFKDVSWRFQNIQKIGFNEQRAPGQKIVLKGTNEAEKLTISDVVVSSDRNASNGYVVAIDGRKEEGVFADTSLALEHGDNSLRTPISALSYTNGVCSNGEVSGDRNAQFTHSPSTESAFSPLENLRQLSYSTSHILPSEINISQANLNSASQQTLGTNGASTEQVAPVPPPSTPPPYQPAPDYESALKQPSLEEYKMALWRQTVAENGAGYFSSPLGPIQNGNYEFLDTDEGLFANSNPELNGFSGQRLHVSHNKLSSREPMSNGRVFASTPDLASISATISSPDFLGTQKTLDTERTYRRLGMTLENLTDLSGVSVTPAVFSKAKVSDECTQTSAPVSRECSSSTVSSLQLNSAAEISEHFQRLEPATEDRRKIEDLARCQEQQNTVATKLSDFEDKAKEKGDSIIVATTIHTGGVNVVRPDLLQGSEFSDVSNDERLSEMEYRLKEGGLQEELDRIPKKRVSAGVSTSQKADNQKRNRYANILPYEDTRIMLRPNKTNTLGYINASNIQVPLGDTVVKYVATQAPLVDTMGDFWQMIWETEARIVVMLTKCQEQGREKCCEYWPREENGKTKLKFGDFQVSLQSSTASRTQVTSSLQLKHVPSSLRRSVYHLQYLGWPEGGVPELVDSFLGFLDEVSSVKRHLENEHQRNVENIQNRSRSQSRSSLFDISNQSSGSLKRNLPAQVVSGRERSSSEITSSPLSVALNGSTSSITENPPVVVHCCSGAGRTGVYILTELMIYCLEHNHNMDIKTMLALLRQQRMHLVQTSAQYKFVYTCLVNYLRNSRLI